MFRTTLFLRETGWSFNKFQRSLGPPHKFLNIQETRTCWKRTSRRAIKFLLATNTVSWVSYRDRRTSFVVEKMSPKYPHQKYRSLSPVILWSKNGAPWTKQPIQFRTWTIPQVVFLETAPILWHTIRFVTRTIKKVCVQKKRYTFEDRNLIKLTIFTAYSRTVEVQLPFLATEEYNDCWYRLVSVP